MLRPRFAALPVRGQRGRAPERSRSRRWRAGFVLAVTAGLVVGGVAAGVHVQSASAATIDTGVRYEIVNRSSGKVLDICAQSTENGACVQQYAKANQPNQQFQFVSSGSGYYRMKARHSGKVLDVYARSTANGARVVQWSDNGGANQQFSVVDTGGGYVKFVNRNSGKVLDVYARSTANGARVVQWSDNGGANQQWQLVAVGSGGSDGDGGDGGGGGGGDGGGGSDTGLVGWAAQGGGTVGGGSTSSMTISSASALSSAVSGSSAKVVRVSGTISCSGMLKVGSNTSILGSSGATIVGCGFNVSRASNVIIRNITFRDWDDDAINVQYSTRVWIDHNSFSNGYDGCVDIKRASDYITVSWNRTLNHNKTMLLGHSDSNASEDAGHLRVTYHHNWFDGSQTRHPRVRFGNPVHVFNNYYDNNKYGVASTEGAGVLVEGNYFENVDSPTLVGYASSDDGDLVQRGNYFVNSGTPESAGSAKSIPYSYSLDSASSVKSIVTSGAGAGRITV